MSQKFEDFRLTLSLGEVSSNLPYERDLVVRLPDPKPAVNIVDENLDYDSDEQMASADEEEFIEVEIFRVRSGVNPMEVDLESARMEEESLPPVQKIYAKPSRWNASALIDRLFCCSAVRYT